MMFHLLGDIINKASGGDLVTYLGLNGIKVIWVRQQAIFLYGKSRFSLWLQNQEKCKGYDVVF